MTKCKKLLACLLSVLMLLNVVPVIAFADSTTGAETVTKEVSLLDLDSCETGVTTALPKGIASGTVFRTYNYDGSYEITETDGEKALKFNFDTAATTVSGGDTAHLAAYSKRIAVQIEIPKSYSSYLEYLDNISLTYNYNGTRAKYEFGLTDGIAMSKSGTHNKDATSADTDKVVNLDPASLYYDTSEWNFANYFANYSTSAKWTADKTAGATALFLVIGVPAVEGTEGYSFTVKDISLTFSGTAAEFEKAESRVTERTLALSSENVSGGTVNADGTVTYPVGANTTSVITLPDQYLKGAEKIILNFDNTTANHVQMRFYLKGTNDNGKTAYWKWSSWHNKGVGVAANTTGVDKTFSLISSGGQWSSTALFETTSTWDLSNDCSRYNGMPSSNEKTTIKTMHLTVWSPTGEEGQGVTLNSITVTYAGNTVAADTTVENGTITVEKSKVWAGDNAAVTLTPADGYIYKQGSLKVTLADGTSFNVDERAGFRTDDKGYYFTFVMPELDVTVSAEFIIKDTVNMAASADTESKAIKFDFTLPLSDGKVTVDYTDYEIVSYGALVTTYEALEKYGFDWTTDLTRELAASDHYIANYIDDINIGTNGVLYDEASEYARYNVIVTGLNEVTEYMNFVASAYVEYTDADGNTATAYITDSYYAYAQLLYGDFYNYTADYSNGINYSGVFETAAANIKASDAVFQQETWDDIAAQGFYSVRIPVAFSSNTDDSTTDYKLDETFMSYLDTAVKRAMNAGFTVVLDFHGSITLNGSNLNTAVDTVSPKFLKIWEQVAERYAEYPDLLMFELINEPTTGTADGALTVEKLIALQEEAVAIIRESNPTRKIAVCAGTNNSVGRLSNIKDSALLKDENVIVSVHDYTPMEFTHQGASWITASDGSLTYPSGVTFSETMAEAIIANLQTCKTFEETYGVDIWISEFGVYHGGGVAAEDVTAYLEAFTTACGTEIDWCVWEYNQGFGAYSGGAWREHVLEGLGLY